MRNEVPTEDGTVDFEINLKVDSDVVQEPHNQELTMDELIEMHELEQDIKEFETLDPVHSGDRMTVGNWTEGLSLIEKGYKFYN
ncbi:hypothetical protein TNCV_946041 [Trichonephila clavipes]|nr:hypothetical protein TNCV_946041 [Trichonephila clavipes]